MQANPSRSRLVGGISALVLATSVSAQINIALCGAASTTNTACQWTDVQTRLQATGLFNTVAIINVTSTGGGTPTLSQLLAYDALLCWTNSTPANNNTWGDVLADYVDAGGGVVVAVFANSTTTAGRNIGGRWQNGYEVILDQSGNASGAASLGTVHLPNHPIMAGVTAFTGGTTGSRPVGTALEVGSRLIAEWSDGKVLVAEGANPKRVDLGFYPPNASCVQAGWATGGDQLMANALLYVVRTGSYLPYGAGCAGSAGTPTLAATGGSRPVLGATLSVTLGNLPQGVAVMAMGFSDTSYPPFSLPLSLATFGMPNCDLLAAPFATQLVLGAGNSAVWTLGIPNNAALAGILFFNQGFSLDPGFNPTGLTVSNGGKGRIGT